MMKIIVNQLHAIFLHPQSSNLFILSESTFGNVGGTTEIPLHGTRPQTEIVVFKGIEYINSLDKQRVSQAYPKLSEKSLIWGDAEPPTLDNLTSVAGKGGWSISCLEKGRTCSLH